MQADQGQAEKSLLANREIHHFVEVITQSCGEIDEASIDSDGSVTFRREIFYRHPQGVERFRQAVLKALTAHEVLHAEISSGEAWQPFTDAPNLTGRSYWFIKLWLA
jgi:hypothetical protein